MEDGSGLFESNSILRYVARTGAAHHNLYGANHLEASQIDSYLDVGLYLETIVVPWIYPIFGYIALDEVQRDKSKTNVKNTLLSLNKHLQGRKHFVGSEVTIADIGLVCSLLNPFKMVFDAEYVSDIPEVVRWFREHIALPEFHSVLGEVKLLVDTK